MKRNFPVLFAGFLISRVRTAPLMLLSVCGLAGLSVRGGEPMTVVSYNIRYPAKEVDARNNWGNRVERASAQLADLRADIAGLQEATKPQKEDMAMLVPGFLDFGVGRLDGKEGGEFTPLWIRSDRFTMDPAECGTFWLSETPEEAGSVSWGNSIPRICTWARLTDQKTGRSFYFYNTHLDHQSQRAREHGARLIVKRIQQRKHADEPFLITGDMNAGPENPAIQEFLTISRDSFAEAHPGLAARTFHNWTGETEGDGRIDYVLLSKGWKLVKAEIHQKPAEDGLYPSDHYAVSAVVEWQE